MSRLGDTSNGVLGFDDIASRITFTTEQVVQLCNVTRRQLTYWVQRGFVSVDNGFSLAAVEKVALIRRALDDGATLRRAVQQVEQQLAARAEREAALERMTEDELKQLLSERLSRLQTTISRLQELVPLHTGRHRILRLANALERLEIDGLLVRPALSQPLQQQLQQLENAIADIERIMAEMEAEVAQD